MKRFKHSAKSTEKIDKFVKFPLQGLDLRHHVSLECPHPPEECIYDLYAVANHSGSLTVGHYTAYNLVEEEEENGEKTYHWVQCNDDVVLKIAKEVVVSNNAYLLFYARRTFIDKDSAAKAYANLDNVEQRSWIGNTI
jgi:ubiquitin C-terminal hydrolase